MKNKALKIALCLTATGFSGVTLAHDTGAQTLGSTANRNDIYRTECFSWGNGMSPAAPAGEANGPADHMFAQLSVTGGNPATISIQALPGGAQVFGNGATSVSPGYGMHYFIVKHAPAGAHAYIASFHCRNAANVHTGTGYNFVGNPPNVTPNVDFVRTVNQ